ncbi:MAG: PAS domain-containing sensor histidine kinase [Chloroflexota bacterium]
METFNFTKQNILRGITATSAGLGLLIATGFTLFFDAPNTTLAMLITSVMMVISYVLAGTKYYPQVIHFVMVQAIILSITLFLITPELPVLYVGILPIFIANIFYRTRTIIIITVISNIVINIFALMYLDLLGVFDAEDVFAVSFLMITLSLLMLVSSYQRQIAQDQAEQRAQQLEISEARFRQIVNSSPNLLAIYDLKKQAIISWNKPSYLGFKLNTAIENRTWHQFIHPTSEDLIPELAKAVNEQSDRKHSYQLQTYGIDNQTIHWVLVQISTLQQNEKGEVTHRLITVSDITAQKQIEKADLQQQLETQKAEMVTTVIRSFSHEFRTPLSIIETNLYLLKKKVDDIAPIERHADNIHNQVEHISDMVDRLNTLIRIKQSMDLSLSRINIVSLVQSQLADPEKGIAKKGISLIKKFEDAPLYSLVDAKLMTIMLDNILDNAIKFTDVGDTIRYSVESSNDNIIIGIHDTGIGISQETLNRIYDMFTRSDDSHTRKGLGIGLSIAHSIASQHGHHLEISSEEGDGTFVTITMPRLPEPSI